MRSSLLLIVLLALAPLRAQAQAAEPMTLASGFTPDPARLIGRTASTVALHTRAPSCRGFAGAEPDQILELTTSFEFLRLFLIAAQDVTLAVRGPDGGWRCATARGDTPALQEGRYAAGRYEVFVGSVEEGVQVGYELQLTEFRSVGPGTARTPSEGASLDVGLEIEATEGLHRDRRIRRGFLPDPIEDSAQTGGDLDVRLLGPSCFGFVAARPSHVLELRDEFDYLRVQLGGASGTVTIVVRTPAGRYLCSSPERGNAFIDQDAWTEGIYRIWIGSRQPAIETPYRICYTEARLSEAAATCGNDAPVGSVRD